MKTYSIARVSGTPDWAALPRADIDTYPWGSQYRPHTYAQLAYDPAAGFYVRLTCCEAEPMAVYTQPDDPVCKDSCLEAFIDFAPSDAPDAPGYLNLEANSKGTYLLGLGQERKGRVRVRSLGCALPQLKAFREGEYWGWEALIPNELVTALYGKTEFAPGAAIRGNFYKCGDDTAIQHYCVWNNVVAAGPDYHRPECFGTLIVE